MLLHGGGQSRRMAGTRPVHVERLVNQARGGYLTMNIFLLGSTIIALSVISFGSPGLAAAEPARAVRVTVLSTMLAGDLGRGIGEWGFAALLEVDGRRLLLDTGERPETVLRNANELGIDLSDVTDLVITHNHGDHTGGLVTLRRELARRTPGPYPALTWRAASLTDALAPTVRRGTVCCP